MLKVFLHQAKFWILLFLGSGFFFLGLLVLLQDWNYSRKATRVEATILSTALSANREKGYRWDLKVRYWSAEGFRDIQVQSSSSTQYKEGMVLRLLLDPAEQGKARVDNGWEIWGPSLLALAAGGILLGYLFL